MNPSATARLVCRYETEEMAINGAARLIAKGYEFVTAVEAVQAGLPRIDVMPYAVLSVTSN